MLQTEENVENSNWTLPANELKIVAELKARCEIADIGFRELLDSDGDNLFTLDFKCGRERRDRNLGSG